jgi:NAD(P)-dependent dehydrogenase (short-subunit alcohol dehydrogenase family)
VGQKQVEAQTPLGQIGQPRDVAPAVVFLASDEGAWITGETLHVSGGNPRQSRIDNSLIFNPPSRAKE